MTPLILKDESGKPIIEVFTQKISSGSDIYVIKPIVDIGPEEMAMVQALYSRSYAPILLHLEEVVKKGSQKFMATHYLGYGHKSIGDLGHILLAVEGVSMLAVKAIQDTQLYNGQEASTRYIDFSAQPFMAYNENGILTGMVGKNGDKSNECQEDLRQFYLEMLQAVQQHLFEKIPFDSINQEKSPITKPVYERTIKARSFDMVRAYLPAGSVTSAAWYTSISHASDHLGWLRNHPLSEVMEIASAMEVLLAEAYPASFKGRNVYPERERYKQDYFSNHYYLEADEWVSPKVQMLMDDELLLTYHDELYKRPKGQELPVQIGECGVVKYDDELDFASYRDQQRHRAVVQRMGLLTYTYGFHDWYIESLPYDLKQKAYKFLQEHKMKVRSLDLNKFEQQYFIPMGYKVPTRLTGNLSKCFYIAELRAQKVVHPTLHINAHNFGNMMKKHLEELFGKEGMPMYMDDEVGVFSLESNNAAKHRGTQTILKDGKEL